MNCIGKLFKFDLPLIINLWYDLFAVVKPPPTTEVVCTSSATSVTNTNCALIGEAHLKSPSPKLARPMPIGHWAGSGKLGQIRACNGRPFLAGFRIGRAWAVMEPMSLGWGARSSYITLKFDFFKQLWQENPLIF